MKNSTSSEPGFVLSPILEKETITLKKVSLVQYAFLKFYE